MGRSLYSTVTHLARPPKHNLCTLMANSLPCPLAMLVVGLLTKSGATIYGTNQRDELP